MSSEEIRLIISADLLKVEEAGDVLGAGWLSARGSDRLEALLEMRDIANKCRTVRAFRSQALRLADRFFRDGRLDFCEMVESYLQKFTE